MNTYKDEISQIEEYTSNNTLTEDQARQLIEMLKIGDFAVKIVKEKLTKLKEEEKLIKGLPVIQSSKRVKVNVDVYNGKNMLVTPISEEERNKANIDYKEQMVRIKQGKPHVWDDSNKNSAVPGDLFAYVFNEKFKNGKSVTEGKMYIYRILSISKPSARLTTWSSNVGQGDRNVVNLSSECIYEGTMKEWKECCGYKRNYNVQGTRMCNYQKCDTYFEKIFR